MKRRALAIAVGLVLSAGLLASAEAGFRWFGTKAGYSQYDRHTRWSLRPGYQGAGPDLPDIPLSYTIRINQAGFRGGAIGRPKPGDVWRFAMLGDSVTFGFGVPEEDALPAKIASLLSDDIAPKQIEWINAGVPGFSTLQGLRHLERRVLPYAPDIVTVMFAWNDGWRAVMPDADLPEDSWMAAAVQSSRFLAFAKRGTNFLSARLGFVEASSQPNARIARVPPAAFETNLLKIADSIKAAGAIPVFITVPAAFGPDRPPESYFRHGWMAPRAELESMRAGYAEATRRAAAAASVLVVDCARQGPTDPALFLADGYHPNAAGFRVIADQIVQAMRYAHLLDREHRASLAAR